MLLGSLGLAGAMLLGSLGDATGLAGRCYWARLGSLGDATGLAWARWAMLLGSLGLAGAMLLGSLGLAGLAGAIYRARWGDLPGSLVPYGAIQTVIWCELG